MKKILVIEDDPAISKGLCESLKLEQYEVQTESNGENGFKTALREIHDLILLDLILPGKDGIEICKDLRKEGIKTPIIMLTSKKDEIDKIIGLEIGADDYVTKPFSLRELLARIKAILRRFSPTFKEIEEFNFDDIYVNFTRHEARRKNKPIDLSATEFKILKYLIEHEGQVISRDQFLDTVWGFDSLPTTRTVDNYILSLRKKIESNPSSPKHLITIHTVGYKFNK